MKATSGSLPTGPGWAYEIKWDGMRVIAANTPTGVEAHSSRLNDVSHRFPELQDIVEQLGDLDAVLDGEIVAMGDDGLPSFSRLQGRMHLDRPHDIARRRVEVPLIYVVFDLLRLDGTETMGLAYNDRRKLLESLIDADSTCQITGVHRDGGAELFQAVTDRGMEGLVAKRTDSPYLSGQRSSQWVKVKSRRRQELVVGGVLSGEGGRSGSIGALLLGYHDASGLRFAGRVGSGLTDSESQELQGLMRPRDANNSPFVDEIPHVPGRSITFVEPALVVEVQFAEWTPEHNLRHPVYIGRHADVDPARVIREPDPAADLES